MRAILQLLAGSLTVDEGDPRAARLRRAVRDAFGVRSEVTVFVLRSDKWAWVMGHDDRGERVSLDVRVHRDGLSASHALEAALVDLATQGERAREGVAP